jgi:hypothetical protein
MGARPRSSRRTSIFNAQAIASHTAILEGMGLGSVADVMSAEPTTLPFEVAELVRKNSHMAVGVKFRFLRIRVGRVKYQLEPSRALPWFDSYADQDRTIRMFLRNAG